MTHPTPLYNALTGVALPLEMPDGRLLNVSVEEVIESKTVKTIKGEGMLNKATNTRGDVIVSFDIKFPRKITQFQKDLLDMALRLPIELTGVRGGGGGGGGGEFFYSGLLSLSYHHAPLTSCNKRKLPQIACIPSRHVSYSCYHAIFRIVIYGCCRAKYDYRVICLLITWHYLLQQIFYVCVL